MINILINAVSVREGGSLVVLRELLTAMAACQPQWCWHVTTTLDAGKCLPDIKNVYYHQYPQTRLDGWKILSWYFTELPRLVTALNVNLLFSQTNYLPFRLLACPTLLLVQHAGHFSAVFTACQRKQNPGITSLLLWWLKGKWVRHSIRMSTQVLVQTAALRDAILVDLQLPVDRISVIPHGTGLVDRALENVGMAEAQGQFRIGYITKDGVQKNFPVVLKAVALLAKQDIPVILVITLDEASIGFRNLNKLASELGISKLIENHGEVDGSKITEIYRSLHVSVFASLCESFGFPMVEAMANSLPLLVADTPVNREVSGAAGLVFPVDNPEFLAGCLSMLRHDPEAYQLHAARSRNRAADFSWQLAAGGVTGLISSRMLDENQTGASIE